MIENSLAEWVCLIILVIIFMTLTISNGFFKAIGCLGRTQCGTNIFTFLCGGFVNFCVYKAN